MLITPSPTHHGPTVLIFTIKEHLHTFSYNIYFQQELNDILLNLYTF